MRQAARPWSGKYQDVSTEPLYWFGFGLSYTSYTYGDIKLSSGTIKKNQLLTAQVEVSNSGDVDGKESVLWYLSDPVASISRPVKELRYFEKKEIAAGQKVIFKFEIEPMRDLSFAGGPDGKRHLESGDFYLSVGDKKIKLQVTD